MLNGISVEYGTLKEAIMILAYTRERNTTFMSGIFPVVSQEQASKAVKQFRNVIFPEEAINDQKYLQKAKELMKRLINTSIQVRPISVKGEMNFNRIKS